MTSIRFDELNDVYPLVDDSSSLTLSDQIAEAFGQTRSAEGQRVAAQFREGNGSFEAAGGLPQLESYYNDLMEREYTVEDPELELPALTRFSPKAIAEMEARLEKEASHERALNLINRVGAGMEAWLTSEQEYPNPEYRENWIHDELYDPEIDGTFLDDKKPGEPWWQWWDLVRPNIGEGWKIKVAMDDGFLDLSHEEKRKAISDNRLGGPSFRALDDKAQDEVIKTLSNPESRLAPNEVSAARMIGLPLRPATYKEVVDEYLRRGIQSIGVSALTGAQGVQRMVAASTAGMLGGALDLASDAIPDGATVEEIRDKTKSHISAPVLDLVLQGAEMAGQDPKDFLRQTGAYLRLADMYSEQVYDKYQIDMPGNPGDEAIELGLTMPIFVQRLKLLHQGLNPLRMGAFALPLDAYLQTKHLDKDVQKQAVAEATALVGALKVTSLMRTPLQRQFGAGAAFTALGTRHHIDSYWQDPQSFDLNKFANDAAGSFVEGFAIESALGAKATRPNAARLHRAKLMATTIREVIAGNNRHAAAVAFNRMPISDKIALSRVLTPHMRTALREGSRDLGMAVTGGSGRSAGWKPPELTETEARQRLIEEAPRQRIEEGTQEAFERSQEVDYEIDPSNPVHAVRRMRGRPWYQPSSEMTPALRQINREEDVTQMTARWIRGDGTFQDVLVTEIQPPIQTVKGKARVKRYPKAVEAFELKPDPNNPPGFVRVYENAAKERVRMHAEEPERILGAHPKNKLQEFYFPDDPRVPKKWRGRTVQVGNQTIESMTSRVEGNLSTSFKEAHDWYFNLERMLPEWAGHPEAGRLVTEAFAPSQKNASPVNGMGNVLRAWEQMNTGVFANGKKMKMAGVAHDQISRAISGLQNYYRDSAKLADFSDLLYDAMPGTPRMKYRSAAGGDPRGQAPVAVDTHVLRARGWVDQKIYNKLIEVYKRLGDKKSLARVRKLKIDLKDLDTPRYEESVRFVNALSEKWRADGFHSEVNHYPGGAQAVLWNVGSLSSPTTMAESPFDTIHAHRRVIAAEVMPSDALQAQSATWGNLGRRYGKLTPQQQLDIAGAMGEWMSAEVMNKVGIVPFGREIETHFNAWDAKPNAGNAIAVYPTAESARPAADLIMLAARQDEVWAWRASGEKYMTPGATAKALAFRIVDRSSRDGLLDTDTRMKVYQDIAEASNGLLAPGFTTTKHAGIEQGERTGITTLVDKEYAGPQYRTLKKSLARDDGAVIENAVRKASEKSGLDLEWGWSYVDVYKARNDWAKDPNGKEALRRLRQSGRGDLAEWMVGEFGPEYERRFRGLVEGAEGTAETYKPPPTVEGGAGPSARDFLRRNVAEGIDPDMPPVAPAYREKSTPDVVYTAKPGQLHADAARIHKLGPKAHVDPSLESGFVDLRTGNWLTRREAEDFLPGWLREKQLRERTGFLRAGTGQADASDFQMLQNELTARRKKRKKKGGVEGGSGDRDYMADAAPSIVPALKLGGKIVSGRPGIDSWHADILDRALPKSGTKIERGFVDTRTGEWLTPEGAEKRAERYERKTREIDFPDADLVPAIRTGPGGEEIVGKLGRDQYHYEVAKRHGVSLRNYPDQGFVNAQTGEWLTEKQASAATKRGARRTARRIPGVSGGVGRMQWPLPGVGQKTRRVVMPPIGSPGRGVPTSEGVGTRPKWMNSTSVLGVNEQAYVENVLYRAPGQKGIELERRRRGELTPEITEKLAAKLSDRYGMTPEVYLEATRGTILTREQQMLGADFYHSASEVAREAERDLYEAQQRGDQATAEHARQAIASMNTKRAKLLMTLYASRSEAGRTLGSYRDMLPTANRHARRALKMIMENEDLPEGARQRLVDRVISAEGEIDVTKVLWEAYKPTWWDKFIEARTAAMLSSPVTIGRNIIGNAAHTAMMTVEEYFALPIDMLYEHGSKAMGVTPENKQWWHRRRMMDLAGLHYGQTMGFIAGARYAKAIIVDPKRAGDTRTLRQRIADAEANQAGGRVQTETAILPAVEGTKGAILRTPFRLQAMGDVFFYEIGRLGKLHQLAMRDAMANQGKGRPVVKGKKRLQHARLAAEMAEAVPLEIRDAIARGRRKPESKAEEMAAEAHRTGLEVTFRAPLGKVPQYLNSIRHDKSVAGQSIKIVVPFMATPINVAKSVAQRTPIMNLLPSTRAWKELSSGERDQVTQATSRIMVGALTFASLLEMARGGYITGDAPNSEMADQMAAVGRPYNSIIMPGVGYAFNYMGWSPMSEFLAMAGNAAQRYQREGKLMDPEMLWRSAVGLVRTTMDQPFLTGVKDMSDAVQAPAGTEGDYKRKKFIERLASSMMVPRGVAYAARATDPQRRSFGRQETIGKGILMGALRDIPGIRLATPEYVDALGRTHLTPEAWLQSFVRFQPDKPASALDKWIDELHDPLRPDTAVIRKFNVTALGRTIGQGTINDMHRARADYLVPILEEGRVDEATRDLPPSAQRAFVEKAVRSTSERVWDETIPLWELDHLGMEPKPDNIDAVRQVTLNGSAARFYTRSFKKDSERRAFIEGIVRGEIDLPSTIREQKVIFNEGVGQ